MLLNYGIGKQLPSWHVLESKAPMYARVYYVFGGETVYYEGKHIRHLEKGWLYIFPVHKPYEMITNASDTLECMHMHLDLRTVNLSHLIAVPVEKDPEMKHLMQTICDAIQAAYPMSYLEILAQAFESLCLIKKLFQSVDAQTSRYIEALRAAYNADTKLSEIADAFGYSTEYFIRKFKQQIGVSPHQYMISLRMSDAVRMLASNATLEEIASSTGYTDGHSFANAFRRYYGISPGIYREHYAGCV